MLLLSIRISPRSVLHWQIWRYRLKTSSCIQPIPVILALLGPFIAQNLSLCPCVQLVGLKTKKGKKAFFFLMLATSKIKSKDWGQTEIVCSRVTRGGQVGHQHWSPSWNLCHGSRRPAPWQQKLDSSSPVPRKSQVRGQHSSQVPMDSNAEATLMSLSPLRQVRLTSLPLCSCFPSPIHPRYPGHSRVLPKANNFLVTPVIVGRQVWKLLLAVKHDMHHGFAKNKLP